MVPDLSTALRRVEEHALPLETARTQEAYGYPSAVNRLLVLNAELPARSRHRTAAPRSHRILKQVRPQGTGHGPRLTLPQPDTSAVRRAAGRHHDVA